jgi:predicted nuclease of restriction endonuclease-like (RecB) superfamily
MVRAGIFTMVELVDSPPPPCQVATCKMPYQGRSSVPAREPAQLDSDRRKSSHDAWPLVPARVRAVRAANAEVMGLYWSIGHDILVRQERDGWGTKVIDRISRDLRREFPGQSGWSRSNLHYMRRVAEVWPTADQFVQHSAGQLPWGYLTFPDHRHFAVYQQERSRGSLHSSQYGHRSRRGGIRGAAGRGQGWSANSGGVGRRHRRTVHRQPTEGGQIQ